MKTTEEKALEDYLRMKEESDRKKGNKSSKEDKSEVKVTKEDKLSK